MRVELKDGDGELVVIECEDTDEFAAILDVLQEKGLIPAPEEDEKTDDMRESASGVTDDDMVDGQERPGA